MQDSQELEDRAELKTSVRVFAHRSKSHNDGECWKQWPQAQEGWYDGFMTKSENKWTQENIQSNLD